LKLDHAVLDDYSTRPGKARDRRNTEKQISDEAMMIGGRSTIGATGQEPLSPDLP
jgi:hypothetical protein